MCPYLFLIYNNCGFRRIWDSGRLLKQVTCFSGSTILGTYQTSSDGQIIRAVGLASTLICGPEQIAFAIMSGIIYNTTMSYSIVVDTNVFISALRSKRGASYKLFMLMGKGLFDINVSVPLVLEYEASAKKLITQTRLTSENIDDIIDYICSVAKHREIFYLWRPFLKDAKDDMVLELAVESKSNFIITYNTRDFEGSKQFSIPVLTSKEFLEKIGGI